MYENDTLLSDVNNSGIWKRKMLHGGVFVYKCVAHNSGGTGNSTSVSVIVNGKKSQNDFTVSRASVSRRNLLYSVLVFLFPQPHSLPQKEKKFLWKK